MALTVYVSYIGSKAGQIIDGPWDKDSVVWLREADLSSLAAYTPNDFIPSNGARAGNLAAAVASVPIDVAAIAATATYVMWDFEEWPPAWRYTDGDLGVGNGVVWGPGYDTDLAQADYDAGAEYAFTGVLDEATAADASLRFGLHLVPNRLAYSYSRQIGNDNEAGTDFAGAIADLAWLGTVLVANNGVIFAWLYVRWNIGEDDATGGEATTEEAYNYAFNNATYYLTEAAPALGLTAADVVFYTWHFKEGAVVRPTVDTIAAFKEALEDAGALHWVVAMGAVSTDDELDWANAYLNDISSLFLTGGGQGSRRMATLTTTWKGRCSMGAESVRWEFLGSLGNLSTKYDKIETLPEGQALGSETTLWQSASHGVAAVTEQFKFGILIIDPDNDNEVYPTVDVEITRTNTADGSTATRVERFTRSHPWTSDTSRGGATFTACDGTTFDQITRIRARNILDESDAADGSNDVNVRLLLMGLP